MIMCLIIKCHCGIHRPYFVDKLIDMTVGCLKLFEEVSNYRVVIISYISALHREHVY
jgi:hypothetical protein